MKTCSKCKIKKNIQEFHKESCGLFGVRSDCKICRKLYKAKNYQESKEKFQQRNKKWFLDNKKERSIYEKNRSQLPQRKIAANLRTRIKEALKDNYETSLVKYIGCSIKKLKFYIESKWQSGMSWDNYGFYGWHIDHIKPFACFNLTNEQELYKVCHYTNLQPLWAKDNLKKGSKIFEVKINEET